MSKKVEYQLAYEKQLESFKSDNSFLSDYDEELTKPDHCIIRLFRFLPEKGKEKKINLLIPSQTKPGTFTSSEEVVGVEITNIGKVVKSTASGFNEGDLVVLPFNDVQGTVENPEWSLYLKSLSAQGATPMPPDDTRKVIPAVELRYSRYRYKNPKNYNLSDDDRITYCIPKLEIIGKI